EQLFQVTTDISTQDENLRLSWPLATLNLVCFLMPKTRKIDDENQLRYATRMKHRYGIPTPSVASPSSGRSGCQGRRTCPHRSGEDKCCSFFPGRLVRCLTRSRLTTCVPKYWKIFGNWVSELRGRGHVFAPRKAEAPKRTHTSAASFREKPNIQPTLSSCSR
ncbi:unnamed protein product, partial [Ectocarpus sp. 8 AP-2014]